MEGPSTSFAVETKDGSRAFGSFELLASPITCILTDKRCVYLYCDEHSNITLRAGWHTCRLDT